MREENDEKRKKKKIPNCAFVSAQNAFVQLGDSGKKNLFEKYSAENQKKGEIITITIITITTKKTTAAVIVPCIIDHISKVPHML